MELFASKKDSNQANGQNPNATNGQPQANQQVGGISGLLNSGKAQQANDAATAQASASEAAKTMTVMSRKIRINEERSMNLRKKTQMIEHNLLSNHKKMLTEMRYINEEIGDLKKEILGIKSKLQTFAHELSESAKKDDVNVLERYINIWEPVNFVTRKEVERVIKDILEEKGIIKDNIQ